MVVYGEFGDMAVFYLKELAKREGKTPMLFCKVLEPVYGVCTYAEFAEIVKLSGQGMYRPICCASPDEFIGLLFARYGDFIQEEGEDAATESVQTGEQPSDKLPGVDAGSD